MSVRVRDLAVTGPQGPIVSGVSFDIPAGRTLAVVGESGSGKSVMARAMSGLLPGGLRADGAVTFADMRVPLPGRPGTWEGLRGGTVALLLQDPFTSLSPVHRCGDQLAWTLDATADRAGTRLGRRERAAMVAELLDEVSLPSRVARSYPHELSGGMRQRVAIAAAVAASPDLLIADEPTTALDASTQLGILDLLARLRAERDLSLLLVSHDLGLVRGHADDVVVLYAGAVAEQGTAGLVLGAPTHPYTAGLRAADLPLTERLERLPAMPGSVPKPGERPTGCVFWDRCPLRVERCAVEDPQLRDLEGRLVACHVTEGPLELAATTAAAEPELRQETSLLLAAGVSKSFGGTTAVDDVSLTVAPGESVGIVGESGSGKTTLARCLAGLESPDAGTITFDGTTLHRGNRTPGQLQVVFQDPYSSLNPRMRVRAILREALRAGSSEQTVEDLLALVGLPASYATKRPRDLSGGERQRVSIARALAPGPQLLICDESVSALDVSVQAQVLNLLADLRARLGLAVLFISHDLAVVRQISDRVYVMRDGRVVEDGAAHRVLLAPQDDYTRALVAASPAARHAEDQGER